MDRIPEIESFLRHGDRSLALRRMLDLSFDAGDDALLAQAVAWSRRYRKAIGEEGAEVPSSFYNEAEALLQRLRSLQGPAPAPVNLLTAEAIAKTYPRSRFSLQPLSLQVASGAIIGIVGENGNGKTTLLRALAGQLDTDAGGITYSQLPGADAYRIKQYLAFIPQRIPRWYGLLKDNLHFSAALSGFTGKENELMVDFMLERLLLADYAHLTWNQISSGYRTRFEIARILLQRPSLLLLDEPLANLDIIAQQTILTDLRYMAKSYRHPMGVVLSSQQLHEVEKIADTVLFIRQGACLYRTGEAEVAAGAVVEVETEAGRAVLEAALAGQDVTIQFNGGYYTLTAARQSMQELLLLLLNSGLSITYFRDITHSTKRFFRARS
jgi:ABC-2 type transport system ATP-binding protein